MIDSSFGVEDKFIWYCEAKVSDLAKDPLLMSRMVKSGLERMQFGSESGNQEILNLYKKEITVEQIYECVRQSTETEITSMFTNVIIGGVKETEKSFKETLEMIIDLIRINPGVVEASSTFLSPYRGTDIRLNPDKYDVEILEYDFTTSSSDSYLFAKSKKLSKERVLEMGSIFHEEVHREMFSLIPSFDNVKIRRQLVASEYNLTTTWYEMLTRDKTLSTWASMYRKGYLEKSTSINSKLLIPCRTFDLEKVSHNCFFWDIRKSQVTFTDYELFLVEKASGKITLQQIFDEAYNSYLKRLVDKDKVQKDILQFYDSLAENFLLCFREFS